MKAKRDLALSPASSSCYVDVVKTGHGCVPPTSGTLSEALAPDSAASSTPGQEKVRHTFLFLEIASGSVALADLELMIFLPQLSKCWNCRCDTLLFFHTPRNLTALCPLGYHYPDSHLPTPQSPSSRLQHLGQQTSSLALPSTFSGLDSPGRTRKLIVLASPFFAK